MFHRFFQEMRLRLGGQSKLRPAQRHSIPISPKASAILVTNTAVGDRQDGAASWRKLRRFHTHKTRQWGRVPPFLHLQQLYLHPGLILPPALRKKHQEPKHRLCIRLSAGVAERRRHFPGGTLQVLESSQSSIDRGSPAHFSDRGER